MDTIAGAIQDELLRDWSSDQITAGIKHIGQTEVGIVTHVYVSRAFFSQLSFRKGLRRWKPFRVGIVYDRDVEGSETSYQWYGFYE